ncbi:hypothetical protein NFX46_18520 [Streptomyces phaeoluteigriseus]|uniref:Major facilitator superfamily (MFS) profile domain-containing protein n=1 Tax=Streptomyces phaeoluteigriseus TaxID=114686 RepID=A0ABY4ZA66_9ACTN|nr:hypothetical protein [Streptomyces phaeoluteigriseus]USQ85590.1 hypothetical protein NFX46_18520 [Streptomyces phaeoluteigriseus]
MFGVLALRSGQPTGVTLCLITAAFVAGLISVYGRIASVAGMRLLLGAVIGAGIPVPGPWWRPPLALLGGSASRSMLQGAGQAWSRRWARMMSA